MTENNRNLCSHSLEARSPHPQSVVSVEALGKSLSLPLSSIVVLPAILGIPWPEDLSLQCQVLFSLSVSVCLRTMVLLVRAHPYDLILTTPAETLFPIQSHSKVLGLRLQHIF